MHKTPTPIKKVALFGDKKEDVIDLIKSYGFEICLPTQINDMDIDAVITYGGDGTIVSSEHFFPGIPKIVLKNSNICKKCNSISNEETLEFVRNGKYKVETLTKLEVEHNGVVLSGIDTILVHNHDPRTAIRYSLKIDDIHYKEIIIGDGFIVATPFGSTGYYKSITNSFFDLGIGVAFNNSTEQVNHIVLSKDSVIKSHILRGPADVYVDNIDPMFVVPEGDFITVSVSKKSAYILRPEIKN